MSKQRNSSLLAAILVLTFASPALANSIAPTAYFWPGVLPLMLGMALPASVIAAVLERPFVSRAGVREYAFWYSLQANAISLVIGYVTLPVGIYAIYIIGPLWSLIAVVMSVVSEGWYYQSRAVNGPGSLRWAWIVWGNVFSSFVLLLLPSFALAIKEVKPILAWELEPYQDVLLWGSVTPSVIVFVVSFFAPGLLRRMRAAPNKPLHLTDIPVSPDLKPVEAAPAGEL
ncbi:MAG TPA: hypothetical protein VG125_30935 [Pirellulales bacterium]|nr:hypothetical protein [Pirellulales bacterium]